MQSLFNSNVYCTYSHSEEASDPSYRGQLGEVPRALEGEVRGGRGSSLEGGG